MSDDFYEIKTPPASQPLLFAEASEWCRDIDVVDISLVDALIEAATDLVESQTNRVFVSRVFTGKFVNYLESNFERFPFVELRRAPLISVTSVKVDGVLLNSTEFIVKEQSSFSRILFKDTAILDEDLAYPIEVEFTAGFAIVPEDLITAIKQIVLFWYENRGDISTDNKQKIPFVSQMIIRKNRIMNSYG